MKGRRSANEGKRCGRGKEGQRNRDEMMYGKFHQKSRPGVNKGLRQRREEARETPWLGTRGEEKGETV